MLRTVSMVAPSSHPEMHSAIPRMPREMHMIQNTFQRFFIFYTPAFLWNGFRQIPTRNRNNAG